jgi:aryl-alcohol dehydrogenase-like predicted oxidoreductase
MQRRALGANGPEISVIGFGAWEAGGDAWGPNQSEDRVVEAIQAGIDAGIDWIDTAEVYGDGTSERLVGRAIAGRRDEVTVATKVAPKPDGTGFRAEEVPRACRASLDRLGVEHIDLYQLHWRDHRIPVEETWEAMAGLVDQGWVRHIGVSNLDRELIERCEAIRHVDSLQPQFSLLHLKHRDLIKWCGEQGIGVVCYGPLAYGLLTGAIDADTEFDPSDWRSGRQGEDGYYGALFAPGKIERSLAVVEQLRPIADRLGITVAQLSLAWTFHQPGVTAAIAGSRNPDHVAQNAQAGEVRLDQATLDEIEAIIPLGPEFA